MNEISCRFFYVFQRELARQTQKVITSICEHAHRSGLPLVKAIACVGGTAMKDQLEIIKKFVLIFFDFTLKRKLFFQWCSYHCCYTRSFDGHVR